MTRFTMLFAVLMALAICAPARAQTVILVRHAEKADQSVDPVLSRTGEARAEALADRLSASSVDLILTSSLQRTRLTAAPTAQAKGLEAEAVGFERGTDVHVADLVSRIRSMPEDSTVLIVGHSNTVPLIARALGEVASDIPDCEYDRLLTLSLHGGNVFAVTTRYGEPSDCPAI